MAVVNVDSRIVSGFTAGAAGLNSNWQYSQYVKRDVGQFSIANGDSANSTYRITRVKANSFIDEIKFIIATAITGVTTGNIGLYATEAAGGGLVPNCLALFGVFNLTTTGASSLYFTVLAADNTPQRVIDLINAANAGKPTYNTNYEYDLVLTLGQASTAAGTIKFFINHNEV